MRFDYPWFPASFEIPDGWLQAAGVTVGTPDHEYYCCDQHECEIFNISDVQPPMRNISAKLDFNGFCQDRMLRILSGFVLRQSIEPISVLSLNVSDPAIPLQFKFRVLDGYHRFHASIAFGYLKIPVKFPWGRRKS